MWGQIDINYIMRCCSRCIVWYKSGNLIWFQKLSPHELFVNMRKSLKGLYQINWWVQQKSSIFNYTLQKYKKTYDHKTCFVIGTENISQNVNQVFF